MSILNDLRQRYVALNSAEKIIVVNVILFILPFLIHTIVFLFNFPPIDVIRFFELSPRLAHWLVFPWTLISYGFFHGSFGHILWNMLLLYYASQIYLNLFQDSRLVNLYFTGILGGGIVFLVSYALFPVFEGRFPALIGSSAGVMAVLIFCCTYSPDQVVRLLFFNVKLRYVGIALVVFDVLQIPTGNAGGHLAHLGGALIGYFSGRATLQASRDIVVDFSGLWSYIVSMVDQKPLKTVYKSSNKKYTKPDSKKSDQEKIDAILDKISVSGYDSLTSEEKAILFKAGKK